MPRDPVGRSRAPDRRGPRGLAISSDVAESPEAVRRATIVAWFVIAAFAAALLFIALGPHRIGAFDVESDFYGGYAPAAFDIQHGHIVAEDGKLPAVFGFVGPLYPAILALGGSVLGDLFSAAEMISVAGCVAVAIFWFLLLRRRAGAGLALVVVLLLVTNPVLARYGYSATSDTTALALQAAALFVLLARRGSAAAAGAGLLAGLATLTRYTSVYLVPAGVVAIAMGATLHPRRGWAAATYALGFLALMLPWQVYARSHGAEILFHQLLAFDVYGNARGVSWDDFLVRIWPRFEHAPLGVLTADPGAVANRLLFNLVDHLRLDLIRPITLPVSVAAVLAIPIAFRDRGLLRLAPLALPGAWAFLALVPAPHNERYSLAVLPFYLLLAGATLTSRSWLVAKGRVPLLAGVVVVGAVVAASLLATIRTQVFVLERQPLEILACADRLRQLARPGDRVIARKPNLAFHARVGFVYFPLADGLDGLARQAREKGARWLFASISEVQLRPQTAFLLDTSATVPGLTLRAYSVVPTLVDGLQWHRVAALYEIGPGFGQVPAWFANDTLRTLHTLRGWTAPMADAGAFLKLVKFELLTRNPAAAQAAWRNAGRMDPAGMAAVLANFDGDTTLAMMGAASLMK